MTARAGGPAAAPVPRSALVLGLAGLIPFAWSAATQLVPGLDALGLRLLGPRFSGPHVGLQYGTIILSFLSGALWGFATKATGGTAALAYALSVVPALWAFLLVGNGVEQASVALIAGFLILTLLDGLFWRWHLAPPWWMQLRLMLTAAVVLCLSVPLVRG